MKLLSGVDLIYLPKFKKSVNSGGENFLRRVFLEKELTKPFEIQHLAGIFAVKEAVTKALSLPTDSWHNIEVSYSENGAPKATILHTDYDFESISLSISHDKDYVFAQFIAILKK